MKIGVMGLGRIGANIVRRLMRHGHEYVVFNCTPEKVKQLLTEGAIAAFEIAELVSQLVNPRTVWLMLPAGENTEQAIKQLAELLEPGDILIDGVNTHYIDDIRRLKGLTPKKLITWTVMAAIDEGVSVSILSTTLYQRFNLRGEDEFARKLLSAMRYQFGGHLEQHK